MEMQLTLLTTIVFVVAAGNANADVLPLESRLGGLAFYDPNLDITWSANAGVNELATWEDQSTWAQWLNIGGIGGWRLPNADVDNDGVIIDCLGGGVADCADNEMGYLFWEEGITTDTVGSFSFVESDLFWSSTTSLISSDDAWAFSFDVDGTQNTFEKSSLRYAWAVRDGDVALVPVPAAIWLFVTGILSILSVSAGFKRNIQ